MSPTAVSKPGSYPQERVWIGIIGRQDHDHERRRVFVLAFQDNSDTDPLIVIGTDIGGMPIRLPVWEAALVQTLRQYKPSIPLDTPLGCHTLECTPLGSATPQLS